MQHVHEMIVRAVVTRSEHGLVQPRETIGVRGCGVSGCHGNRWDGGSVGDGGACSGILHIRSLRMSGTAKDSLKAGGVALADDLPRVGRDAAVQDHHLLLGEAAPPLILAGEAREDFGIRPGEPDAVALNGGLAAALVSGLVLVDAHKRSQRPAVVIGEPQAQVFDEVFLAHG